MAASQVDSGATTGYEAESRAMAATLCRSMLAAEYRHVVPANGSMSSRQRGEGEIRTNPIGADLVGCMVALPGQLYHSTRIPACPEILARGRRRVETLSMDTRKLGRMVARTRREPTGKEIARIAGTKHSWKTTEEPNGYADVLGLCKSAALGDVRKHGHVLTPGRYIGVEPPEDDGGRFEEKMTRSVAKLREQQAVGARLDAGIAEDSKALGCGGRGRPGGVS